MGLMDSAVALISGADRQLATTAHNLSNMTTPGYRARQSFAAIVNGTADTGDGLPLVRRATDFSPGKVTLTANPYDLALGGAGFFVVRSGDETRFTRNGQFERDSEGRLVTGDGFALQGDGGDIVLRGNTITVEADGTVLDNGEPVARILVRDFAEPAGLAAVGGSAFRTDSGEGVEVLHPNLRQGALETSNVSTAHEMVTMMQALRQAETGQRLVRFYDELLGDAITSFGGVQT
jgi:flagellar basal body rod protein FlgG